MKETFTLSKLLNQVLQEKQSKTEYRLEEEINPREESIQMIISYSKSVRCIKTTSIGDVFVINN